MGNNRKYKINIEYNLFLRGELIFEKIAYPFKRIS